MKKTVPRSEFTCEGIAEHLAADRTILANERTLLSYIRFSFALFVAGISLHRFFEDTIYRVIGIVFIPLAVAVAVIGIRRYRRCQRFLATLKENDDETLPAPPRRTAAEREGPPAAPDPPGAA